MKSIFNKGAFKIKAKVIDELKSLDGSILLTISLDHYESGQKVHELIEVTRTCTGKFIGTTV